MSELRRVYNNILDLMQTHMKNFDLRNLHIFEGEVKKLFSEYSLVCEMDSKVRKERDEFLGEYDDRY